MGRDLRLLRVWRSMRNRCYNKNQKSYPDYGGRGIEVCDRWRYSFEAFIEDMGTCPDGYTLERIDVNGNYEPSNCTWISKIAQASNKRNNRYLTANGETKTMAEWARVLGCNPAAILYRLNKGWPEHIAVTTAIPERPNAKLTLEQARDIRRLYPEFAMLQLSVKFGVSQKTVSNIIHHKIFKED